jgi:hypothetical protein
LNAQLYLKRSRKVKIFMRRGSNSSGGRRGVAGIGRSTATCLLRLEHALAVESGELVQLKR